MFINQYYISNRSFQSPADGKLTTIGSFTIWSHENLETTYHQNEDVYLVLLGFAFQPNFPENSNLEILETLAEYAFSSPEFFNYFNQLTGRFVLLVKSKDQTFIFNDPGGQRQVFYTFENGDFYATSSPKLFYDLTEYKLRIPVEKQIILDSKRYKILEEWFPGDEYLDEKLKRLLPNFFLEIENKKLIRIPFQAQKFTKEDLKKYIQNQIYGAMEACLLRFHHVLNAVTAGSDSRLIFNATPRDEKLDYFLYKRESENDVDLKIAKELTKKKKINLTIIQPEKLSAEFITHFKNQFLYPRVLSKLRNIEWLKKNYQNKNTIVIAGYAGEMLRNSTNSINPYQNRFDNPEDFVDYLHYPKTDYLKKSMEKWVGSTNEYLENCKHLSLLDLFHWEQHMAPYCAKYAYEQDISGVEIFCPLSNRQLILNLIHNTTTNERSAPNGIIYQIINETSPEWKGIPYNPKPFHKKLKDEIFKRLPLTFVNRIINR